MIYEILTSDDLNHLREKVNYALAQDWRPQGGVEIVCSTPPGQQFIDPTYIYAQAVVKE